MTVSENKFIQIMNEVLDNLPERFAEKIHNLAFFVEDFPTREQLGRTGRGGRYSLLGLYEGYYQSSRRNLGPVMPDRITLFRVPIMQSCSNEKDLRQRIEGVLRHEIAHHFGSDETGARKTERGDR